MSCNTSDCRGTEEEECLEQEIQDMLSKGIVKKIDKSRWCSPFFLTKATASAVDFRRLNPMLKYVPLTQTIVGEE